MLADKRKRREIALELLNKVSIKTKTGTKAKGVPPGTNKAKKPHPCLLNPIKTQPNHKDKLNETIATN